MKGLGRSATVLSGGERGEGLRLDRVRNQTPAPCLVACFGPALGPPRREGATCHRLSDIVDRRDETLSPTLCLLRETATELHFSFEVPARAAL